VLEQDAPVGADGVEGELLSVDELLDADLGHVPELRQDLGELAIRVDPEGVGRARAGDRLDDERVADLLGGRPDLGDGARAGVPWRADARGVQHALHRLLVPERHRLLDGETGQAERLPDARRQHHVRLPEALHLVDRGVPRQPAQRLEDRALVSEVHVLVMRE
jgi:hypothetical protein